MSHSNTMRTIHSIIISVVLSFNLAYAFEPFTVEDIRLEGLRRISPGTVFNYLPIQVGDTLDAQKTNTAIKALFKTGLFKDIQLAQTGSMLTIRLEERPTIAQITFTGNDDLETEELIEALKGVGFAEGRVFNRSLLEKVELVLQRQYFNLGKYAVHIASTVTPVVHNRVNIQITVKEGQVAKIQQIRFIGNHTFSDETLLEKMTLSTGGWFSFYTQDNQYSRQKLAADIETLRAYYLDRGYINFNLNSAQVSITPDKKGIYITLNLTEGEKYTISSTQLVGNLIVPAEELNSKITLKSGDIYSQKIVGANVEAILERIGNEGYAFANINTVPEINNDAKTVALKFFIDPGKRVYVRRINFFGNTRTRDEVLRREMRQIEGGWIATSKVKRSQERLERLAYFDEVKLETAPVPDSDDQVDLNFTIVEKPSGNLQAGFGYSQVQGLVLSADVLFRNFLGSGRQVGVTFNNSQIRTTYRLSHFNPYTNIDGISRGFSVFYRETDAEEANLSRYTTDQYGLTLSHGLPITEYNSISMGFEFDNTRLKTTDHSAQEVSDFIATHGDNYNAYRLTTHWTRDTRDRTLFPDRGMFQRFRAEVALPFSDLDYYKMSYRHQWLNPIVEDYILLLEGEIAYGDGYGDSADLPFFENYTAGGPRSVRGFKANTLGPLDSKQLPLGGNLKVVGNLELIVPVPFTVQARSFRLSAFVDAGNVYSNEEDFDASLLRYSTGLSAIWWTRVGVLNFSLAKPFNTQAGDQTQTFQFSISASF